MSHWLIDANLPSRMAVWSGPEFVHVNEIDPAWDDRDIWHHALAERLTIVIKDTDFFQWAIATPNSPHLAQFRIGNMRLRQFEAYVIQVWPRVEALFAQGARIVILIQIIWRLSLALQRIIKLPSSGTSSSGRNLSLR